MSSNIQVSSTITLNTAKLEQLTRQQYVALAQTADATLTELRDRGVMPFNTGNLQNDSTYVDDSQRMQGRVRLVSSAPYARRLYYHPEYNYRRTNNARAGGRWFDSFLHDSFVKDAYKRLYGAYLR